MTKAEIQVLIDQIDTTGSEGTTGQELKNIFEELLNNLEVENPDAPNEAQTFFALLATTATLNACTYNNGTLGILATLTGDSNGILSQSDQTAKIDNTTVALGDFILIKNQIDQKQNGIYEATDLGSAGTPFILTRIDGYDETAEIYPSVVFINGGASNINKYFSQNTVNPVLGTDNIVFAISSPASPILPITFIDMATSDTLDTAATYTDGTAYINLPAFGATLKANSNGSIGTINGITITIGMKLLLTGCTNPFYNGDYTVINAGSATSKWKLQRIGYNYNKLGRTKMIWFVNNPNINYGQIWTCTNDLFLNSDIGSIALNFAKTNNIGLRDNTGRIELTDGSGDMMFRMTDELTFISDSNGDNYLEINNNLNSTKMYNLDGGKQAQIDLNTSLAGQVILQAFSPGVSSTLNLDTNNQTELKTNGSPIYISIDDITFTNANVILQNNSAALRCYSDYAVVEVTAGSADQGLILDRTTLRTDLFNNEGSVYIKGNDGIALESNNTDISLVSANDINMSSSNDWLVNIGANININANGGNSNINITTWLFSITASDTISIGGVTTEITDGLYVTGNITGVNTPNYANDAAADADTALPSGGFYTTTAGGRALFRKP